MSGICGIINFDGAPVDAELLRKMAGAAAYRGPDGIHYWVEGNVGMAHLALHTTPESVRERQPLVNQRGDLVLVADARVDNREELESVLSAKGYLPDHPTDADFILAAYECWGENCPKHLVGDFAFVIWDKANRKIFAARDQMGVRLLHYRHSAQQFVWATEARQLLVDPDFSTSYNEVLVAQDLASKWAGGRSESYYKGIQKIVPANFLSISNNCFTSEAYWDFNPAEEIRYHSDEEYADHFRILFRQAVRSRLRSISPVGIFMSGGIDSTSVAAIASEEMQLRPGGISPRLEAVNWAVQSQPEYSETDRSRAVAEKWGFGYREVDVERCWPFIDFPGLTSHPDDPFVAYADSYHRASLNTFAENEKPRVWLNGYGGDAAVGGFNLYYYWDLLVHFRWKTLIEKVRCHQKLFNLPASLMRVWILSPFIFTPTRRFFQEFMKRDNFPVWLETNFIKRTGLRDWKTRQENLLVDLYREAPQWKDPQRNLHYRRLKSNRDLRLREWYNRFMAQHSGEMTGPWDDIRLAQYLLAIPADKLAQGINHKLVLRHSLKGILPDIIRERRAPRSGTPFYLRNSLREPFVYEKVREITSSSKAVRFGWVNKECIDELIKNPERVQQQWGSLWQYLLLEIWLQTSGMIP